MPVILNRMLRVIPWSWRGRIKHVPGLAYLQRVIVHAATSDTEFVYEVDSGPAAGVRFFIRMPEDKGIWTGTYEAGFATRVAAAVKPGAVAYDVGGWHGFFAGIMAERGARQVHVFEPLPANIARIEKLIELNPNLEIQLHKCALGAEDGETELLVMPESSMAKLSGAAFQRDAAIDHRVPVRLATLDRLVEEAKIPPPDLIKMDVEGAEAMVFKGGLETLRKHRPVIFAEVHSRALLAECSKLLSGLGYAVSVIDDDPEAARARDVFQVRAVAS